MAETLVQAYERLIATRSLTPDSAQLAVAQQLNQLATQLQSRPQRSLLQRLGLQRSPVQSPRGIYLWGPVGRGKTLLMDLLQAQLPSGSSKRVHFHSFMREVHAELATLRGTADPLRRVARQLIGSAQLLCLDELFVTDIGDAMILHGLLDALLTQGIALVITSNTPPHALYAGGLQRERFLPAIDLLQQRLDVVELDGGLDYRLRQLEQAGTWIQGNDAVARQRLHDLFTQLAGGSPQHGGGTTTIEGRQVPRLRAAEGIEWFEFAALCEGARGTHDYLALVSRSRTLFVSNVPCMDALQDDAARRFISLVDVAYDAGITLVIGAAAAPADLYAGTRLAADFQRTTSRLIEMQSRDYLANSRCAR